MRSELINEIFAVESEAETIVSEARKQAQAMVAQAQHDGDERLKVALDQAREEREATVATAEKASQQRIETIRQDLAQSEQENKELHTCAERIAQQMVTLLCSSTVGETQR